MQINSTYAGKEIKFIETDLTYIRYSHHRQGHKISVFRCKCGNEEYKDHYSVMHGITKSCTECKNKRISATLKQIRNN